MPKILPRSCTVLVTPFAHLMHFLHFSSCFLPRRVNSTHSMTWAPMSSASDYTQPRGSSRAVETGRKGQSRYLFHLHLHHGYSQLVPVFLIHGDYPCGVPQLSLHLSNPTSAGLQLISSHCQESLGASGFLLSSLDLTIISVNTTLLNSFIFQC